MRHFLRFLCGWLMLACWTSADRLQDFIDGVGKLHRTYELKELPICGEQFLKDVSLLKTEKLTERELRYILCTKLPQKKDFSKITKKTLKQLERRIFAKVLLLALLGCPQQASDLLGQFEGALARTEVAVVPTNHPWIILLNCITTSCLLDPGLTKHFGKTTQGVTGFSLPPKQMSKNTADVIVSAILGELL